MLKYDEYVEIGKAQKLKDPTRWEGLEDDEIGVIAVKHKLHLVPDYVPEIKTSRWRSPEGRLQQHDKQEFDRRLGQQEHAANLLHHTVVETYRNQAEYLKAASDHKVSTMAWDEMAKMAHTADVEVKKAKEMDVNRLNAYEREAKIDFIAAQRLTNAVIEELKQAREDLTHLLMQPRLTGQLRLAQKKAIRFQEKYIEQMERRLLQSPDQADVQGTHEAPERPASGRKIYTTVKEQVPVT